MKSKTALLLIMFLGAHLAGGCKAVTAPAASEPQAMTTAAATEQTQFDPQSIAPPADQPVLAGECAASVRVQRAGAYSCTAETGAAFDPCFVLAPGGDLGCQPNPPAGRYSAIVKATNTPLPEGGGAAEPLPFYLSLGPGKPPCAVGVNAPMQLEGQEVTWRCEAPGAWIMGELQTARPDWRADYVVTDSTGSKITYGPEETVVVEAWVY